jgi:hypothetical protein
MLYRRVCGVVVDIAEGISLGAPAILVEQRDSPSYLFGLAAVFDWSIPIPAACIGGFDAGASRRNDGFYCGRNDAVPGQHEG